MSEATARGRRGLVIPSIFIATVLIVLIGLGTWQLERKTWKVPPVFDLIRKRGRIADDEMYGTFNMGLGMILVVDPGEAPAGGMVVGEVVRHTGPDRVVVR